MFDLLTYQKGGSVLRMLERWLGADAFRAGVRALPRPLPAREHRDDRPLGLAGVGDRANRCAGSWTRGSSSPASRSSPRERDGDQVTITQQRFSYEGRRRDAQRWAIPVRARVHDGRDSRDAVAAARRRRRRRSTFPPTRSSCSTPAAKASTASSYPRAWRDRLLDAGVLEPLERFSLVDDLWASVLAGDATRRRVPRARAPAARRRRPRRVARARRACCAARPRLVDGDALARLRAEVGRRARRRRSPASAGTAAQPTTHAPASCAASCSTRSARSSRTRR